MVGEKLNVFLTRFHKSETPSNSYQQLWISDSNDLLTNDDFWVVFPLMVCNSHRSEKDAMSQASTAYANCSFRIQNLPDDLQ
jgi:hypothetical protein